MSRRLFFAWRRQPRFKVLYPDSRGLDFQRLSRSDGESALRTVRKAQGLSLRQAADGAGIDPGHLSRVERGEAQLSLNALRRLAKVLRLRDLERLLGECVVEGTDA